jgi:hypothetical protein
MARRGETQQAVLYRVSPDGEAIRVRLLEEWCSINSSLERMLNHLERLEGGFRRL